MQGPTYVTLDASSYLGLVAQLHTTTHTLFLIFAATHLTDSQLLSGVHTACIHVHAHSRHALRRPQHHTTHSQKGTGLVKAKSQSQQLVNKVKRNTGGSREGEGAQPYRHSMHCRPENKPAPKDQSFQVCCFYQACTGTCDMLYARWPGQAVLQQPHTRPAVTTGQLPYCERPMRHSSVSLVTGAAAPHGSSRLDPYAKPRALLVLMRHLLLLLLCHRGTLLSCHRHRRNEWTNPLPEASTT
mmetsp:Transcript_27704/g.70586  ORF Transcript_27704/g.70586 Transcript_27704/m.70586 type:complete len:242 (-) Transcript_27704:554-1279(-)